MRGYYEMPDETAAVLHDGWLRTGDLVTANGDGTYTFVGRKKEVIRRRGENLSPAEVEAALERHPDVAEAAVIGVPSELSEEDVKAFVVAAPGRADRRRTRCTRSPREQLAAFKVPRYFEVVDDLPHTPDRPPGQAPASRPTARRPRSTWSRRADSPADDRRRMAAHVDRLVGPPTASRVAGRDLAARHHGPADAHRARLPARRPAASRRPADAGCSTRCSCRSPTTASRRARSRPGSPTRARPRRCRARSRPACSARGACSSAPPGDTAQFLADALARPRRDDPDDAALHATSRADRGRACRRGGRARARARPSRAQGRGPAHAAPLRARRARRPARARTCGCSGFVADAHDAASRAGTCRSTAPARAARALVDLRHPAVERARLRADRAHGRPRRPPRRRGRRTRSACRSGSRSKTAPAPERLTRHSRFHFRFFLAERNVFAK